MLSGKRVLFVHSSAGLYGADRCLIWMSAGLQRQGMIVNAVLPFPGRLVNELEKNNVTVHVIDPIVFRRNIKNPSEMTSMLVNFIPKTNDLIKLIRKNRFDVVHTNTGVTIGGALAAKLTNTPHIWHFREVLNEFKFFWLLQERLVSGTSNEIICISKAVAFQFKTRTARRKINVVHDGIPVNDEQALAWKKNNSRPYRLLSVGLLAPYKGQDVLINAVKELRNRGHDVHLDLIGGVFGERFENLNKLVDLSEKLELQNQVRFLGFQENLDSFMLESDFFILPSRRPEGLGLVVLEAMAKGRPVIATGHGGVTEVIKNGENGVLVPPDNQVALAEAIAKLIKDPYFAEKISRKGYETAINRFSLPAAERELSKVYKKVLTKRNDHPISSGSVRTG